MLLKDPCQVCAESVLDELLRIITQLENQVECKNVYKLIFRRNCRDSSS